MTTPNEVQPKTYSHNNGTRGELVERFAISELCKGWPVYRDASEWNNYRSLFTEKDAYVWTTWSGALSIDDFIAVSKKGKAHGDFIMHRECGTLVDLNIEKERAIGKMKATITQHFVMDGVAFDVDCDCRFIFFCLKEGSEWKTRFVKLFYEKDKIVPQNGVHAPLFKEEELNKYPQGYKYLGAAQARLGHPVLTHLPTLGNEGFEKMYECMGKWLEGEEISLFW